MPKEDASVIVGIDIRSRFYGENSIFITGQKVRKTNTQTINFKVADGLFTVGNEDNQFTFDFVNNPQEIPSKPQAYDLGTLPNSSHPLLKEIVFSLISPQPETEESDNEEKPQDATAYTENSNLENDEIPDQDNNENTIPNNEEDNINPPLEDTPSDSEVSDIDGQQTTVGVSSEQETAIVTESVSETENTPENIVVDIENSNQNNNENTIADGETIDPPPSIISSFNIIIIGTNDNDTLPGTTFNDIIDGRSGNDAIFGLTGNDAISGDEGNDIIDGGEGNDLIFGHDGNDIISGGDGLDILIGVNPTLGFGSSEQDMLEGGENQDIFVLGDENYLYYDDNDPLSFGEHDYGLIRDFTLGEDIIELHGEIENYSLDFYTTDDGIIKADIVYDSGVEAKGELIGIIENADPELELSDSSFVYSENDYESLYNEIFSPLESLDPGIFVIDQVSASSLTLINSNREVVTIPLWGDGHVYIFSKNALSIPAPTPGSVLDTSLIGVFTPPNIIEGTNDDDVLVGTDSNDMIYGFAGNDDISGLGGDDTIYGGDDEDTISGGLGDDNLDGGDDDDLITGGGGNDTITAGDGDDTVSGGFFLGLFGVDDHDQITAGKGDDDVSGGYGNDTISGDQGEDTISGGLGDDNLDGGDDDDLITGEEGNDTITAGEGDDTVSGGDGNDTISGDQGEDTISGGLGNDNLDGGDDDDLITGGEGNDTITAGDGDDTVFGGLGNDNLDGGTGDDIINGVSSNTGGTFERDTLTGGSGSDRFILGDKTQVYYDDGNAVSLGKYDYALITDFNASEDFIQLYDSIDFYQLDLYTTSSGNINAALMYDPGVTARRELIAIIEDVSADLNISDSSFVIA